MQRRPSWRKVKAIASAWARTGGHSVRRTWRWRHKTCIDGTHKTATGQASNQGVYRLLKEGLLKDVLSNQQSATNQQLR